ncbi:helix-turn-helix domain-containing protein [Gracilibacillus salitolerans]|uniref:Helix-turn-helix domain-containing protein n=1 Tax=Gracilibacillus salitolerans TaxID=2663022 RepID=A0A5Q2TF22_9BACI|nr:helix-turn-helix transcriptional regulator [Gracilibacillus salitolerans]QGH32583.1 helix-turn-helix domain-containing protein [Gracilibacillus salitolerans]
MEKFGDRLKRLRQNKKLYQKDLAQKLNISKSAIGMYERNEREPSFELLTKISDYFDVSISYLVDGKEHKKEEDQGDLFFFDMKGLTEEEIDDIKRHIDYVKWKAKQDRGE